MLPTCGFGAKREDFSHFLGWSARSAKALLNGGDGGGCPAPAISAALAFYEDLYEAAQKGESEKAYQLQEGSDLLGNLYQSGRLLRESLAALKIILKRSGLCDVHMMPPLCTLSAADEAKVLQETEVMVKKYPGYFKNN